MGEFELIERFFKRPAQALPHQSGVDLGIGDDCALLQPHPGHQVAISSDMLVEGRHFFPDVPPEALGYKALAVNLSDLAAMGAEPLGFTLALALPPARANDEGWLGSLSNGLLTLADQFRCPLIGGDTTAGPLNLCLTVFGQLPKGLALRRDGAHAGDDIWVSGTLGDARLALGHMRGEWTLAPELYARARQRLERPTPRVALGLALRELASACADVSDGLAGDLGHILKASGVGAELNAAACTLLSAASRHAALDRAMFNDERLLSLSLTGGDDYELVFTAPRHARETIQTSAQRTGTPVTRVGEVQALPGLRLLDAAGQSSSLTPRAFDHFA